MTTASSAAAPRPRILVTADMSEDALAALRGLGDVEYASFRQRMRLLAGSDLVAELSGVQVFVTEIDIVDVDALRALPDLRVLASCRGQAVNVDVPACTAFGVPVLYAPGRNADAVADLTLAFLLMLARKLPAATAFLRQGAVAAGDIGRMGQAFSTLQGRELWHKTVGLVGFGAVGRGVARRLVGFDARVVVHDPFVPADAVRAAGAEPMDLPGLLAASDFVSLHAPVTDETSHVIGAAELARMKPGAYLVNTARAALVDEAALVEALGAGRLAGAALDVFPVEPPGSDHPLLAFDTVIATPHIGGNTEEIGAHQGLIVAGDLGRVLRGEPPRHVLNPDVLARFDWHAPRTPVDDATLARLAAAPKPAVSDIERGRTTPAAAPAPTPAPPGEPVAAPRETVERMTRLVEDFTARLAADPELRRVAEGTQVTLRFTLTDLPIRFHVRLDAGTAAAGLGDPPVAADVELAMRADVLDGMFTGRVNAMQAATTGRLSFRGDTMKAMTLQQLQPAMQRHWAAARAAVGDPGDLTALAEPAAAHRAAPTRAVLPGDPREEVVRIVHELYVAGLVTATGGNVSVRVPGRDEVWITPSQSFKGQLRPEMLVRLDLEGQPLDEGALAPSSERMLHCAIYRARPDAGAVVHAHAPHATILANTGLPFLPISTEAAFFGDIPRVPFIMPGTDELARAVGAAAHDGWAVFMVNHGIIVAGRSLRRAADMVEIIDRSAEVILGCYAVGKDPSVLPDDVVRMLRSMGDLVA